MLRYDQDGFLWNGDGFASLPTVADGTLLQHYRLEEIVGPVSAREQRSTCLTLSRGRVGAVSSSLPS